MRQLSLWLGILWGCILQAQVGINTTNPQAQLEIQSTDQANPSNMDGILIPKIDTFPAINPGVNQNGMLVFLTTTVGSNVPGFYYWDQATTSWLPIGNNNSSGWNLNGNSIAFGNFLGTTNDRDVVFKRQGVESGIIHEQNTAFGYDGVKSTSTGLFNTSFGALSLSSNTTGSHNTAIGRRALQTNTSGFSNTGVGFMALATNTSGQFNTALGYQAAVLSSISTNATAIGSQAAVSTNHSLVLGSISGVNGATTTVKVGIGTTAPQDRLHIVGNLRMEDGNQAIGKVLTSDANGTASWQNVSLNTWNLDGNTVTNPSTQFLGTTNDQALAFRTNNLERVRLTNTGKWVMGTGTPLTDTWAGFSKVVIGSNDTDNDVTLRSSGSDIPAFNMLRSNGVMTSPTVFDNGEVGSLRFWRYAGTGSFDGYVPSGRIISHVNSSGTRLIMSGSAGNTSTSMTLLDTGELGLGTITPTNKFHIFEAASGGTAHTDAAAVMENSTQVYQQFLTPSTFESGILFGTEAGNTRAGVLFNSANTDGLSFRTGGNNTRMVINNLGQVGIGINAPLRPLHVIRSGTSGGTSNGNTGILLESNGPVYQHLLSPDSNESGFLFGTASSSIQAAMIFNNSANSNGIVFRTGGNTNRVFITSAGDVGLGTATPGGQLELSLNEGRKPGTSTWTITSDARLKQIIGDYQKGLQEIEQLHPIRYRYQSNQDCKFEEAVLNQEFAGFTAQDVQKIFPEAVNTDANGYLTLDIHPVLIASINAIKELNEEIHVQIEEKKELQKRIEQQQQAINNLLERVSQLERATTNSN